MERKWMRRTALVAALVTTLVLAAPAQAAGWAAWKPGPDLFQKAWQWIARLWTAPEAPGKAPRDLFKAGGGIDPMGGPSVSSPPSGQTQGDTSG